MLLQYAVQHKQHHYNTHILGQRIPVAKKLPTHPVQSALAHSCSLVLDCLPSRLRCQALREAEEKAKAQRAAEELNTRSVFGVRRNRARKDGTGVGWAGVGWASKSFQIQSFRVFIQVFDLENSGMVKKCITSVLFWGVSMSKPCISGFGCFLRHKAGVLLYNMNGVVYVMSWGVQETCKKWVSTCKKWVNKNITT